MNKFFEGLRNFFVGKPVESAIKKELSDSEFAKLKKQYTEFMEDVEKESKLQDKTNREAKEKHDSICPKCKSANVNDRIKRFQGSIDGKSSGSGWSALSFGESQYSGYIKGKFDTSEVNKCNDCENEWKKWEGSLYTYKRDLLEQKLRSIRILLSNLRDTKNITWDKLDLKETFDSLEAKQEDAIKKIKSSFWVDSAKRDFSKYSIELVEKLFEECGGYELRTWKDAYDYKFLREEIGLRHINEFLG